MEREKFLIQVLAKKLHVLHSSIIGNVVSGQNSIYGANCSVIGGDYKSNSLILGHYPNNKVKKNKIDIFSDYYF